MSEENKHFIKRYEELLNKGYCDCNEMNCIDNNSPRRILNIVKDLQQENKQLKNILIELEEWLNLEIAIHDEDDTIDTLYSCVLDKIQELKEKYNGQ